jgi:hypothetical protein
VRPSISLTNYGGGRTGLLDGPVQATRAVDQGGLDTVRVPDPLARVAGDADRVGRMIWVSSPGPRRVHEMAWMLS